MVEHAPYTKIELVDIDRFNPQMVERGLYPEYLAGVESLIPRIRKTGATHFALIGMGSLTRKDKPLRIHNEDHAVLESDADFLAIATKFDPFSLLAYQGNTSIARQSSTSRKNFLQRITHPEQVPFSPRIPYFQVEILTVRHALKLLQHSESVFSQFNSTAQTEEDWVEERRHLNSVLILHNHIKDGVLLHGTIPDKLQEAQARITAAINSTNRVRWK